MGKTYLDAAYEVLRTAGQPLHYQEIAARALTANLVTPKGKTPVATMGSRLYVDTKKPGSRFSRAGKGTFTLAKQSGSRDIGQQIEHLNEKTRVAVHGRLKEMPADRFEALVAELLIAIGFDEESVEVTSYGGDGGVDVRGVLNAGGITEIKAAVQAKRWKKNIPAPVVQSLRGSLTTEEQGIIIATSGFSKGAIREASAVGKTPISLVDGQQLLDLLIQHNIGVNVEQHTVVSLDEEYWGEVANEETALDEQLEVSIETSQLAELSYPLEVRAWLKGREMTGALLTRQGEMEYAGKRYRSPSQAGIAAAGWKSCNGWRFWRYQHLVTGEWRLIDELRAPA